MKKYIKLILIIVWMIVIFLFSNENATNSGNRTISVIDNTTKIVTGHKVDNNKNFIYTVFKPVRKCAHFFIYLILGILVLSYLKEYNISYKKAILFTVGICFLYAISDEVHQFFVDGRTSKVTDILIDTTGSLFGCTIIFTISKLFDKHKIKSV